MNNNQWKWQWYGKQWHLVKTVLWRVIYYVLVENLSWRHRCRLRSYRYVGPHWSRGAGLHGHWGGATSLDGYVSQSTKTYRAVAHATGGSRKELNLLLPPSSMIWSWWCNVLSFSFLVLHQSLQLLYFTQHQCWACHLASVWTAGWELFLCARFENNSRLVALVARFCVFNERLLHSCREWHHFRCSCGWRSWSWCLLKACKSSSDDVMRCSCRLWYRMLWLLYCRLRLSFLVMIPSIMWVSVSSPVTKSNNFRNEVSVVRMSWTEACNI